MNPVRNATGSGKWVRRLESILPAVYFFFVFFLYFSTISSPYFTDEQDVFYGAYNIIKGKDIYQSFLSQHMPFSYYLTALVALCGARTVYQFRFGIYLMLTILWECVYLRHCRYFHPVTLFAIPLLYLTLLKTMILGTCMMSDHWQGIGLILIMLELIRYVEERRISRPCAFMVALGILLSLGTIFASAYSVFCFFVGMVVLQWQDFRRHQKEGTAKPPYFRENLRLVLICLAPFLLLGAWYLISGNLENFYQGAYEIVTEVYSRYIGGLGSNPVSVVWETVVQYGQYLWNLLLSVPAAPWPNLLYLLAAFSLIAFAVHLGKKAPAAGIVTLLAAIYGGMRGFDGFHGMAYHALTAASLALWADYALRRAKDYGKRSMVLSRIETGAAAVCLMLDFVIWGGYNLLYPQILLPRTPDCEEQILALLTEPGEEVFVCNAPVYSLDMMDLDLVPSDACGAISYPYFYEMWGDRQMKSIQDSQPNVVIYDPDESIWGYRFQEYAADFDTYVREHYTRLPQAAAIWVSRAFLPEAASRLRAAGYGDQVISNGDAQPANYPVKYYPEQSVEVQFTALQENLTAIRFTAACFNRRSCPALLLQVLDTENEQAVAEGRISGDEIADNFFSRCPLEACLTPGKDYLLRITVERIDGKGDMEFYFTPEGELSMAAEYRAISAGK